MSEPLTEPPAEEGDDQAMGDGVDVDTVSEDDLQDVPGED